MSKCELCKLEGGILTIAFHICPLEDDPRDYLEGEELELYYKQIKETNK